MTPEEIRLKFSLRNRETVNMLQFFADAHLHPELREVTRPIRELAFLQVNMVRDGQGLVDALRELRDARDYFIYHYLASNNFMLKTK